MNESIITPPIEGKVVEFRGMRVRELIEELQKCDPEAFVLTVDAEYGVQNNPDVQHDYDLHEYDRKQFQDWDGHPSDAKYVVID